MITESGIERVHVDVFRRVRQGMTPSPDPDKIDPTDQGGRPVMVTGAIIGILLALALLVGIYFLAT